MWHSRNQQKKCSNGDTIFKATGDAISNTVQKVINPAPSPTPPPTWKSKQTQTTVIASSVGAATGAWLGLLTFLIKMRINSLKAAKANEGLSAEEESQLENYENSLSEVEAYDNVLPEEYQVGASNPQQAQMLVDEMREEGMVNNAKAEQLNDAVDFASEGANTGDDANDPNPSDLDDVQNVEHVEGETATEGEEFVVEGEETMSDEEMAGIIEEALVIVVNNLEIMDLSVVAD